VAVARNVMDAGNPWTSRSVSRTVQLEVTDTFGGLCVMTVARDVQWMPALAMSAATKSEATVLVVAEPGCNET
jgi:hypothetical protein